MVYEWYNEKEFPVDSKKTQRFSARLTVVYFPKYKTRANVVKASRNLLPIDQQPFTSVRFYGRMAVVGGI